MSVKLITYDLNREVTKNNYETIYEFLRWNNHVRLSESSYAVDTEMSIDDIYELLTPALDENDCLLVFKLYEPVTGRHRPEVNEWLKQRLSEASEQRAIPKFGTVIKGNSDTSSV